MTARGDYLVIVNANQAKLYDAIALLVAEPPETFARVQQIDQQGERVGLRRLEVSGALAGCLD